jgi:hypothetical protein
MITKKELPILNSLLQGVKFVYHGPEYANGRKPPFEGQVHTIVGFEPRYVNDVVVREPDGTESLLPLDEVKKALTLKSLQAGAEDSNKFPEICIPTCTLRKCS